MVKNTALKKILLRSFYYVLIVTYVIYFVVGLMLLAMYYKITKYLRQSMDMVAAPADMTKKSSSSFASIRNSLKLKTAENGTAANDEFKQVNSEPPVADVETKLNINNDFDKYIKPRKQLIMMLMCVIVAFYVCLFPLKIWTLILMFIGHRPSFLRVIKLREYWYISIVVRFFFYANSSINPILYNFMSKKFRMAFKNIFIFRLCFSTDPNNDEFNTERNDGTFKRGSYYSGSRFERKGTKRNESEAAPVEQNLLAVNK